MNTSILIKKGMACQGKYLLNKTGNKFSQGRIFYRFVEYFEKHMDLSKSIHFYLEMMESKGDYK